MKLIKAMTAALSLCLLGNTAFAQEPRVVVVDRSAMVYDGSSEYYRMKQKFQLAGQLVGIGPVGGATAGLIGGYFIDKDTMIQVEALGGTTSASIFSNSTIKGNSVGAYFKKFSGNSFYMKGGIDYSRMEYTYRDWFYANEGYYFRGTRVGVTAAIGNQWQWENFTIGCDWIGWSVPVSYTLDEETISGSSSYYASNSKEAQEYYLEKGYPVALHFYMGASF